MRPRIAQVYLALVLPSLCCAQQDASLALNELVPIERQKHLGIDKLTAEQRAGVARLLVEAYQIGLQQKNETATTPQPARALSVIETQVDGDFEGWEGETIVKLMNGQIWQQTEYYYTYHYAFMPNVLIYRSDDSYKMKVDGVDKAVGVERLR